MTITTTAKENTLYVALEGRIDTISGPQLERELSGAIDNIDTLILNLPQIRLAQ